MTFDTGQQDLDIDWATKLAAAENTLALDRITEGYVCGKELDDLMVKQINEPAASTRIYSIRGRTFLKTV